MGCAGEVKLAGNCGVDLTQGSIRRHLVLFSIPMLAGSVLQTAYSIVNAIWVGNGLGANAVAALTVSFSVYFVLMAIAGGLTLATTILVSQAYGAKNLERVRRVINNSVVLIGAVSIICMVTGYLMASTLLKMMNTPVEVMPMAECYLRLLVWTIPFLFGTFLVASVLRGMGDSKTPLYFQAIAIVLTAVLDPILIFGWLGFPKLGLNGTAYATIVGHIVALVALLYYLKIKKHVAAPDWRHLRIDLATSLLTIKIGVPSMFQQALVSVGMLVVIGLVNNFGSNSTAAYGIVMRIDQLALMPAMTIGMAVSTLAGQNIGARSFDRVRMVFWNGILLSCCLTAVVSIFALVLPGVMLRLFVNDPAVITIGIHYLRIIALGYLLFAVMFVSNGIINGAGHTLATTMFTLIGLWLVRVPLATYLAGITGQIEGIWWATVVSFAIGMGVSLIYYASGRWRRVIVKAN